MQIYTQALGLLIPFTATACGVLHHKRCRARTRLWSRRPANHFNPAFFLVLPDSPKLPIEEAGEDRFRNSGRGLQVILPYRLAVLRIDFQERIECSWSHSAGVRLIESHKPVPVRWHHRSDIVAFRDIDLGEANLPTLLNFINAQALTEFALKKNFVAPWGEVSVEDYRVHICRAPVALHVIG